MHFRFCARLAMGSFLALGKNDFPQLAFQLEFHCSLALTFFSCKTGILSIFSPCSSCVWFFSQNNQTWFGTHKHTWTHTHAQSAHEDGERRRFLSDAALHLFCLSWEGKRTKAGQWGSPQKIACQVKLLVCQRETG